LSFVPRADAAAPRFVGTNVVTSNSSSPGWPSALYRVAQALEDAADAIAHLALQHDSLIGHGATGSALAFQPLAQIFSRMLRSLGGRTPPSRTCRLSPSSPCAAWRRCGPERPPRDSSGCCTCRSVGASHRPGTFPLTLSSKRSGRCPSNPPFDHRRDREALASDPAAPVMGGIAFLSATSLGSPSITPIRFVTYAYPIPVRGSA
jgi:hypothetical protein